MKIKNHIVLSICMLFMLSSIIYANISFASKERLNDEELIRRFTGKVEGSTIIAKILRKDKHKLFEVTIQEERNTPVKEGLEPYYVMWQTYILVRMTIGICVDVSKGYGFHKLIVHHTVESPNVIFRESTFTLLSDFKEYAEKRISRQDFEERIILSSTGSGINPRIVSGSVACSTESDLDHVLKLLVANDYKAAEAYFEQNRCMFLMAEYPVTIIKYPERFPSGNIQFAFRNRGGKFWTSIISINLK